VVLAQNTRDGATAAADDELVALEVDASVAALHAAADAMRESARGVDTERREQAAVSARPERVVPPPPIPLRAVADPARGRLAVIAEALERERFDVMLEPILGLKDRRAQHYIVTVQLKGVAGGASNDGDMGPMARGSGLLPLLDAVKIERAARVAWRMEDRGKAGALFSQMSGESLVSDRFLNRFADTYRQGDTLGSRLVLSFKQVELRTFSELQWSTLRDMADLGFRFCLEDITDLDLDFAQLSAAGFTFAKLDAAVFLGGLPAEGLVISAADICRHFASLNLAVIVGEIADEELSRRLLAYGVELGQGRLFGAPRAVKADVLRNPHAAVA
jgi:cyclic-di-GMP phosphodiesterase, flagellum assembly factor TipF